MMDANIENNELDQDEEATAQQEQEQEQQQVIAAANKQRQLKIDSVLEKKGKFPLRNRKKIDVLIQEFLEKLGDDIHDMLLDNHNPDYDTYDGLDSNRDTEEELETAIRFFPEVLSRRKDVSSPSRSRNRILHYPIQQLAMTRDVDNKGGWQCNVKTVSFVPIVARLAIEFGLFEEGERGGLLIVNEISFNVLHYLMSSDAIEYDNREAVDDKYLQVLIKLRQLDLLKKEDIQSYNLLDSLCIGEHFPENRYKMLVEWDPNALTHTNRIGELPLNDAMCMHSSIQIFQIVFEYGIRYFPKKKGISLLFHKANDGRTTFQRACVKFGFEDVMFVEDTKLGCEKVMKVVEDTLASYSGTPVNVPEALLSAAIDENVHLDCVYFLLRREPDLLLKLLPQLLLSLSSSVSASGSPNDNTNDNNKSRNSSKKRKRKTTTAFLTAYYNTNG